MAQPGRKLSGLVNSGAITLDPTVEPSNSFQPAVAESSTPNQAPGVEFMADVDKLVDSPFQKLIRRVLIPSRIDETGNSLRTAGQKSPITVRRLPNGMYELIKGHYRKEAAKSIGWKQLRALLVVATDKEAKQALMLDNEGTPPSEYTYAHMFRETLEDKLASTQEGLALHFGCSQSKVSNCLAMLDLPPELIAHLEKNPALFGAAAAKVLQAMWAEYPEYRLVIIEAVEKLADGAEQSQLRKYVEQRIAEDKRKHAKASGPKKPPKQAPRREIIKGHTGQECYVTILKDTAMTVEFKDLSIDKAIVQHTINKALMELVKSSAIKTDDE